MLRGWERIGRTVGHTEQRFGEVRNGRRRQTESHFYSTTDPSGPELDGEPDGKLKLQTSAKHEVCCGRKPQKPETNGSHWLTTS